MRTILITHNATVSSASRPIAFELRFGDFRPNVTASKLSPRLWCTIRALGTLSRAMSSMQNKARMLAVLGLVLTLAGCGPEASFHPIFRDEDVVFDPSLVGTWRAVEGKDEHDEGSAVWTIEKSGDDAYSLVHIADGKRANYKVHVANVGEYLFFDAEPDPPDGALDGYCFLMPTHVFGRISLDGDTARINFLDDDWVKKMADEDKLNLAFENVEDTIVLTASTKELQTFALSHAEDEEAFSNVVELKRQE